MKKVKIVNKGKFFRFIGLVSVLIIFAISLTVNASGYTNSKDTSFIDQFEQVEVFIRAGETSWDIQQELTPSYDVREVLHFAGLLNNKRMGNVKAGETLIFLKERN